jgi:hypothetical protein
MPGKIKKSPRKRTKKKSNIFSQIFSFKLLSISFLIIISITFIFIKNQSQFCANSISCIKDLSGKSTNDISGTFMGKGVKAPPPSYFVLNPVNPNVLGASEAAGQKHIFVNLTTQHLYAYQGGTLVYDFPISSGKWNLTPTGTFKIWVKLTATRMKGGQGADYYNLPNVPWTMFFYNSKVGKSQGFSLHGAYWHDNFGHPMSHGCVNISVSNAKILFDWANPTSIGNTTLATEKDPGTVVTIYGITPNQDLTGTRFLNNNVSPDAGNGI